MVSKTKKYFACICGAFAFGTDDTGGQPIKTKELYYALCEKYGKDKITYIETMGWKKHPLKLFFQFINLSSKCQNLIMLPAHHGVKVFSRLFVFAKQRFSTQIFYDVVGGWLPEKITNNKNLKNQLAKFDGIWVETKSMCVALQSEGFTNVCVINNFKHLNPVDLNVTKRRTTFPIRLCTFSRVVKEKGIEDAISSVIAINISCEKTVYTLDIYGKVYEVYKEEFNEIIRDAPSFICYKGIVQSEKSTTVLSNYDALLFPTRFFTEGIPGTIIDAYTAGLPVIASKWKSFADVIDDGITGIGFNFESLEDLLRVLSDIVNNPLRLEKMKDDCLKKAEEYTPEYVMRMISAFMEGENDGVNNC